MYKPADIITYEGRVWDVDAQAWERFTRGKDGDQPRPRCVVIDHVQGIPGVAEHVRVKLANYPSEPYEYLIFETDFIEKVSA